MRGRVNNILITESVKAVEPIRQIYEKRKKKELAIKETYTRAVWMCMAMLCMWVGGRRVCMTCMRVRLGAPAEQVRCFWTGTHGRAFAGGMWSPRRLERLWSPAIRAWTPPRLGTMPTRPTRDRSLSFSY